jgi:hypothetical protein
LGVCILRYFDGQVRGIERPIFLLFRLELSALETIVMAAGAPEHMSQALTVRPQSRYAGCMPPIKC